MLTPRFVVYVVAFCALIVLDSSASHAQEAAAAPSSTSQRIITGPNGQKMLIRPGQPPMPIGEAKPSDKPATKPDEKEKEDDKKKDEGKKDDKSDDNKVVTRPTEPPEEPNSDELKVAADEAGMLRFNFQYQPWAQVLEWLARVSNKSLDWQELPGGFLNLSTQRPYSVDETRDLINRHLLARGYTLLQNGEILSVVKVAEINSGMVPRVSADELKDLMPHEFAKVSFELDWLLAEAAVEELAPMKSPNGKLTALKSTNRIEAMDAVVNLREIHHLLQQEQSESGQDSLIQEFVLEHARASDVMTSLQELLGLESKQPAVPMSPQQMQQMQQMMQQMQRSSSSSSKAAAKPPSKPAEVHLIVNGRKNSVVAHAPPDKMAIIEKAVEALDVATSHRDGLLNKPFQIHAYRLHSLSPGPLVKTLQDVGDLDPNTRLEADDKSNSIVAYASLVDHTTIQQLIANLDGSGREFEVIQLRRLAADYVAGTIEFMMIGEKEEKEQPRYFSYSYSSRYGNNEENGDDDEFRVDADVENNMLLLWANEIEIEAVRKLLIKLGEIPPEGGRTSKMRVLNVPPAEDAAEFLERLRQAWPSLAPNELNLPTLPEPTEKFEENAKPEVEQPEAKEVRKQRDSTTLAVYKSVEAKDSESGEDESTDDPPVDSKAAEDRSSGQSEEPLPPTREELRRKFLEGMRPTLPADPHPVNIAIDHAGRLVITSQDTAALDMLEELVAQLAPPTPDYKIYKLEYVDAYYVKDNLEDFFKEEEDEDKGGSRRYYFYDYAPKKDDKSRSRLSQRPKLKFIYDYDSNSILVQGASADQLKTIEELIAAYDKPDTDDSQSARFSATFKIEYSKASIVAETIKDVYRDLLSSNDKSLQQGNPEAKNRQPTGTTYIFNDGEGADKPDRSRVSFKGKLSFGVDDVSNLLLVSCEGEQLMKSVSEMIETIDEAAKPVSTVSVVQLSGNVNAEKIRAVLLGMLGEQQASAAPNPQGEQPNGQQGRQPRGNRQSGGAPGSE